MTMSNELKRSKHMPWPHKKSIAVKLRLGLSGNLTPKVP